MDQVIVGVFGCWRDGHETLRALQLLGLRRDDAHLYRAGVTPVDIESLVHPEHDKHNAEYAAHGEHQGVITRNKFVPSEPIRNHAPTSPPTAEDSTSQRTLLVVRLTDEIRLGALRTVMHEHGAIAVKDPSGQWRFSPFRRV